MSDEHIAIVGPNGAGKTLLVDTLIGKYPLAEGSITYDFSPSASQTIYDNVKYIAFRDTYVAADATYYYQQRWNMHDQEEIPTVRDMLGEVKDERLMKDLIELLDPRYIEVCGKFLPRGGISIDPFANYGRKGTKYEEMANYRLLNHDLNFEKVDNR